jgi:hypothetical protein
LALLEVTAEDQSYQADSLVRDAAREAQRQHQQQQAQAMRDKASALLESAWVTGTLEVASGAAQVASACSQYSSDVTKLAADERPDGCGLERDLSLQSAAASRDAKLWGAASSFLGGSVKVSDMVYGSLEANHDADATNEAHLADEAKSHADDAASACQRSQAQLDQKLTMIEGLMRSEEETMRNLIHRA